MKNAQRHPEQSATGPIAIGVVTLLALVLAFLAFHDIGVREVDLSAEYGLLVVCGAWMLFVAAWLLRTGRKGLSVVSILALAGLAWGTRNGALATPPRTSTYVLAAACFAWFVVLSGILLRSGRQILAQRQP
jgi:hypothetical protein